MRKIHLHYVFLIIQKKLSTKKKTLQVTGNICYEEEIADCDQCSSIAGDLNLDNETNIQDVVIIINCILDDNCDECSDMNGDEIIDILDIVLMVNFIMDIWWV